MPPIFHFEDYSGAEFERLIYAYHARTDRWRSLEWYGQSGKDKGRDILGHRENDTYNGEKIYILCANWKALTFAKARSDMNKTIKSPSGKPDKFRVVTSSKVTATLRDQIRKHSESLDVHNCETWSGPELTEWLWRDAESLLRLFMGRKVLPDDAKSLTEFARSQKPADDEEALYLISRVFDRPVFFTPARREDSVSAFDKAIEDTISALNTGIWQTREGHVIGRLPSKDDIQDVNKKNVLTQIVQKLSAIKRKFKQYVASSKVRYEDPDNPQYSLVHVDPDAAAYLDRTRSEVLALYRTIHPPFNVSLMDE